MARRHPKAPQLDYLLPKLRPAAYPSFAEVAQPNFCWYDVEADAKQRGLTIFPQSKKAPQVAGLVSPSGTSTEARLIRIHELLHARFTPEINSASANAAKARVSDAARNYAEDHRIFELGKALPDPDKPGQKVDIFDRVGAHLDIEVAREFAASLASQGIPAAHLTGCPNAKRVAALTTAKAVQLSIALSGYPCRGFDPRNVEAVLACFGEAQVVEDRFDLGQIDALLAEFYVKRDAVFAKKRKGKHANAHVFAELARLIDDVLVRAAASELPKKPDESKPEQASSEASPGEQAPGDDAQAPGDDAQAPGEAQAAPSSEPGESGSSKSKAPSRKSPEARAPSFDDRDATSPSYDDVVGSRTEYVPALGTNAKVKETPDTALRSIDARKRRWAEDKAREEKRLKDIDQIAKEGKIVLTEARQVGSIGPTGDLDPSAPEADLVLGLYDQKWAPMRIQLAPLTKGKKNLAPRNGRAGTDGAIPRHFSRWFSDRAILETKGRRPGGALLIDVSGSMSWTHQQTQKLVDEAPALTVAIYSSAINGSGTGTSDGHQHGLLTIIARNGRIVEGGFTYRAAAIERRTPDGRFRSLDPIPGLHEHSCGNVCDGPALLWLARQPGPRVWFCDGQPSGKGDEFTLDLTVEAFRIAYLAQVTRTTSFDVCLEILRGTRKPTPVNARVFQDMKDAAREHKRHGMSTTGVASLECVDSLIKSTGAKPVDPKARKS